MDEARFAALIRRHLPFYRALAEGARAPATAAQKRFVAVARGEVPPETEHEQAFARWRQGVQQADRALATEALRTRPGKAERSETKLRLRRR